MEIVLIEAHTGQSRLRQGNVPSLPDRELLPQDTLVKEDTPKMCIQTTCSSQRRAYSLEYNSRIVR